MVPFDPHENSIAVLVVEDDPGDVRLIREAFRSEDLHPTLKVVGDGELALQYLRRAGPFPDAERPDIIILDLNLPKRDGREVLAEVKGDAQLRSIPIIVFTTSGSYSDVRKAYDLYANCYIQKPSDFQGYLHVIQACERFWMKVARLPS